METALLRYGRNRKTAPWGAYTKRELPDYARSLALNLFNEYDDHISPELLFKQVWCGDTKDFGVGFPFSELDGASFIGVIGPIAPLIEMRCDNADARDFSGYTPLAWAAYSGYREVIEILLGRGEVNLDRPDNEGQTPLSHAANHGHQGAVKRLRGREDVDPDKPDN